MIKATFFMEKLTRAKADEARDLGFNTIFTYPQNLDQRLVADLKAEGMQTMVVVNLFEGEANWQHFPDSQPVGIDGQKLEKIDWYAGVCPTHRGVLAKAKLDVGFLATETEISGLWFNFARFPGHWEAVREAGMPEYCFCTHCDEAYAAQGGGKLTGEEWTAWKCSHIVSIIKDLKDLVQRGGRELALGMNLVPWRLDEYNGALRGVLGQDPALLAPLLDYLSPMCHQGLVNRPVEWVGQTIDYFKDLTGKGILPIVQAFDAPGPLDIGDFEASLHAGLEKGLGFNVFFFEALNDARKGSLKSISCDF